MWHNTRYVLKASIWLPVENNLKCSSERELPFMFSLTSGRCYTMGMKQVSSKHVLQRFEDVRTHTHTHTQSNATCLTKPKLTCSTILKIEGNILYFENFLRL
jgi:hypothetical protein